MAAPTFPTAAYSQGFSGSSFAVTISNGMAALNSCVLLLTQEQATVRTISSIVDNGPGNVYSLIVEKTSGATGEGSSHIYYVSGMGALSAGAIITVTFNASTVGNIRIQEMSPTTYSGLSDSHLDAVSGTNHNCGATGINPTADFAMFACSDLNGTTGGLTAGVNWTRLGTTAVTRPMFQYILSAANIGNNTGPFTNSVNNRIGRGCIAAFYASGGGGRTTKNTRSHRLGIGAGAGFRVAA